MVLGVVVVLGGVDEGSHALVVEFGLLLEVAEVEADSFLAGAVLD